MRIFFASDFHGSDVCWRKFVNAAAFYQADLLICGGDLTGKILVPIVAVEPEVWRVNFLGKQERVTGTPALRALQEKIRLNGMYPVVVPPEEYTHMERDPAYREAVFEREMAARLAEWMDFGDARLRDRTPCYVIPGNDDTEAIDPVLADPSHWVQNADESVVEHQGFYFMFLGGSNPTPWHTPREFSEDMLAQKLHRLANDIPDMSRAVVVVHVPPFGTGIDNAPVLNEQLGFKTSGGQVQMAPVGSTAVRDFLLHAQPLLSLHGHIHESRGAHRLGRTIALNPGSEYAGGRLSGVLVDVAANRVRHQFVLG
jgi:Icc-related predicted phosphoesterase